MTVSGSGIGNRKELHKLFHRVFMPYAVFRGGELHSQQLLVIEPVANRNMLPVQKIFKPLWEKLVLPKCQMAGILQNCIPSF